MNKKELKILINKIRNREISIDKSVDIISNLSFEELDFVKVDYNRLIRTNIPEVIFAKGKKTEDIVKIAKTMFDKTGRFLITKAQEDIYNKLNIKKAKYHPLSGVISCGEQQRYKKGNILIISAGTSDIPVAEESMLTSSFLGSKTECLYDVGVAGIHRLFKHIKLIKQARTIVVVAGMEGALPSIVGGLIRVPVIAVPTSVGYGVSLGGITALFAMLNSCVPGLAVMNIDNGFGAGCLAHKININR